MKEALLLNQMATRLYFNLTFFMANPNIVSQCVNPDPESIGLGEDQVCIEPLHVSSVNASCKNNSRQLMMAAGLLALSQASCLLDATGSCTKDCLGEGGGGGSNTVSASNSSTGGSETVGGMGGMGGAETVSSSNSGTGGMNEGGAGGTGGAGGCQDIPVTVEDTTGEYELQQYDAACAPNGVGTLGGGFETGSLDLCLKPGESVVVQTKNLDMNALQFTSPTVPSKVQSFQLGVNTPISGAEAGAYCSTNGTMMNPVSADQDPTLMGFKYVPPIMGPTNIIQITY